MSESYQNMDAALWVFPDGPNTEGKYAGCHSIASVTEPRGTNTLHYCRDPKRKRGFVVDTKVKGPPGLVTFTVETKSRNVRDYLQRVMRTGCAIPLVITTGHRGAPDNFAKWELATILHNADITQRTFNNPVASGDGDEDLQMFSFDFESDKVTDLYELKVYDMSVSETEAFNAIFACGEQVCASAFGPGSDVCSAVYAVSDPVTGSAAGTAGVWKLDNTAAAPAWTELAVDPFATDEAISAGVCFTVDRDTTRLLVFRGTTDGANPAEAAYSDDDGATWTTVNIGSVTGEFVPNSHSVMALDQNNIWVGTDGGYIYHSNDGGATWSAQESANIHSAAWNWIEFVDEYNGFAGGAADVIAYTVDGGETWSQATAPGNGGDILDGSIVDANHVWVVTDDGEIFFTDDGGTTWTERTGWTGSGVGSAKAITFVDEMFGVLVRDNASPVGNYMITKNGGQKWEGLTTPTNAGLNDILVCSPYLMYGVGETYDSTATAHKIQPIGG